MMSIDDDAVKIMEEATATVAEDTRSKFPDLSPLDVSKILSELRNQPLYISKHRIFFEIFIINCSL